MKCRLIVSGVDVLRANSLFFPDEIGKLERVNFDGERAVRPYVWYVSEQNSRSFDLLTPY